MSPVAEIPFGSMFPQQHDGDDFAGPYPETHEAVYNSGTADMSISSEAFGNFSRSGQDVFPALTPGSMGFEASLYADPHYLFNNNRRSPTAYADDSEVALPSSNLSSTSAPSATSSAMGSPRSIHHGQAPDHFSQWDTQDLGLHPAIVSGNDFITGTEYSGFADPGMDELAFDFPSHNKGFVDPSLIHPEVEHQRATNISPYDAHFQQFEPPTNSYTSSVSSSPHQQQNIIRHSPSPLLQNGASFHSAFPTSNSPYAAPIDPHVGPPSMSSFLSPTTAEYTTASAEYTSAEYASAEYASSDETKEKQRCSDCGKVFKDLKAHMLTHQTERPEKCPIQTCEYHVKGFARKYDKNRHTLTHYKGTMVCGFCPGPGSAAEKSFNRADVFKRHLTAVHAVEQTPPNSRKKTPTGVSGSKKITGYAPDATGKCSTCSQTFSNAQDFYEHLDDCVLRIVQQEDPAEAINALQLAKVENDENVHETLQKNNLPITTTQSAQVEEDEDGEEMSDEKKLDYESQITLLPPKKSKNPPNGVQKSRGLTHSRGGVALTTKTRGRKNRRDYPLSWGFDKNKMVMKKRVLCCFDGPRRLSKDDMSYTSTEYMVRIALNDGVSYITDLDAATMQRAEGIFSATDADKGAWVSDDPTEEQRRDMQEVQDMLQTPSPTIGI